MKVMTYTDNRLSACAEFWWEIYRDRSYVHRPDGYQTVNTPPVGPSLFARHLTYGFDGADTAHWQGEVSPDSVILAEDKGRVSGILVCSVDKQELTGNILAAYFPRDQHGREIAALLVNEALGYFQKLKLQRAVAAPHVSKSLEVECPIHLALLDTGFAWEDNWEQPAEHWSKKLVYAEPGYGVFLGGSLADFRLHPKVRQKVKQLLSEGVSIERRTPGDFGLLRRQDTGKQAGTIDGDITFAALVDDLAVGWLGEVETFEDEGRIMGAVVPEVIPSYRSRGIGKVLYHLGIEEVVRRGAQHGWSATGIHNPARAIYQSVGYRYWYTSFNLMSKRLAQSANITEVSCE